MLRQALSVSSLVFVALLAGPASAGDEIRHKVDSNVSIVDSSRDFEGTLLRTEDSDRIPIPKELKGKILWTEPGFDSEFDLRALDPKFRVYFDTGTDDDGEVDVFRDGELAVSVNLLEARWNWFRRRRAVNEQTKKYLNMVTGTDETSERPYTHDSRFSFGLAAGFGLTSPAEDSGDDTESASDAPVLLLTIGAYAEFKLSGRSDQLTRLQHEVTSLGPLTFLTPSVSVEAGYAYGISASESVDNADDGAVYVGLGVNVPVKWGGN